MFMKGFAGLIGPASFTGGVFVFMLRIDINALVESLTIN